MSYIEKLIVKNGRLDRRSVFSLSWAELRQWIFERLHGRDIVVPGGRDQPPYYVFSLIYPDLDRAVRQDIDRIVSEFIRDMMHNAGSPWINHAANDLLLLAQALKLDQLQNDLVEMAKDNRFFITAPKSALAEDVHYRILQSLIALDWRGTLQFWYDQAALSIERYGGVAFNGLALIDIDQALSWLCRIPWSQVLEDQLYGTFLELLENTGTESIKRAVERVLPQMSPQAQQFIRELMSEEGITLTFSSKSYDITRVQNALRTTGKNDFRSGTPWYDQAA